MQVNLLTSDQLTDKNTQKTIDETLKDSVTLNNGTKASPTAEWKNDKDDKEQLLLNICRYNAGRCNSNKL